MTPEKAEQQARKIVEKGAKARSLGGKDFLEAFGDHITTALLSAYQEGKREQADRIAELEGALEKVTSEVAAWNRDVAAIIGRIPKSGIDLNDARAVLEKGGAK